MAKEDKRSLLAKVVKFVRNPTTDWSKLDQASTFEPSGQSQLMLKEMMERKKRNDFVRRREFDMLRKIRRREQVQGAMPVERASFFQSSLPANQAERANTLKKIDEIEAQMSMQWWKTKARDASLGSVSSVTSTVFSRHPEAPVPPAAAQETTIAAPLAAAAAQAARAPSSAPAASSAPGLEPSGGTSPQPAAAPGTNTFASTQSGAIEVHEVAHDPEMEEVYIRFAGGDVPGAEAALLDLLARESAARDPIETWMTLFDLYRATGQQERFELAALDFASQFQRSAPQWWSMPSLAQSRRAAQAGSGSAALHWSSPGRLNAAAVMGLRQRLEKTAQPWRLDWSPLQSIEPDALPSLHLLFSDWAAEPVEVHMVGADGLLELLAAAAPSGDRSIDARWWHVRLSLLRAMGRADEFELAALDYCVTYEVSPPSWEAPRGRYRRINAEGVVEEGISTFIGLVEDAAAAAPRRAGFEPMDFRASSIHSSLLGPTVVELSGELVGDISATVRTLAERLEGAELPVISCRALARVDFAAAGELLNWLSEQQAQGRSVHFEQVHRLVAGFFRLLGIADVAQISTRVD